MTAEREVFVKLGVKAQGLEEPFKRLQQAAAGANQAVFNFTSTTANTLKTIQPQAAGAGTALADMTRKAGQAVGGLKGDVQQLNQTLLATGGQGAKAFEAVGRSAGMASVEVEKLTSRVKELGSANATAGTASPSGGGGKGKGGKGVGFGSGGLILGTVRDIVDIPAELGEDVTNVLKQANRTQRDKDLGLNEEQGGLLTPIFQRGKGALSGIYKQAVRLGGTDREQAGITEEDAIRNAARRSAAYQRDLELGEQLDQERRQRSLRTGFEEISARRLSEVGGETYSRQVFAQLQANNPLAQHAQGLLGQAAAGAIEPSRIRQLQDEAVKANEIQLGSSRAIAEAAKQQYVATEERNRALARQQELAKQIAAWEADGQKSQERGRVLLEEQREVSARVLEAEQKRLDALKQQQSVQRQTLEQWRTWAIDQQRAARELVAREQERLKSLKESFGLQTPVNRLGTLQIARKIAAGGGMKLTGEELEFAKGQELLQEPLRRIGAASADQQGDFKEIVRLLGIDRNLKQAQADEKRFGEFQVKLENAIQATIVLNEKSLGEQIQKQLVPQVNAMIQQAFMAYQNEVARGNRAKQAAEDGQNPH